MARLTLLIMLNVLLASAGQAQPDLSLEVEGQQLGVFSNLVQDADAAGTVTLEQGWISPALLELWWPGLEVSLKQGENRFPDDCVGRRVEVTQVIGDGARGRSRAWVLMDACPLICEVEEAGNERIRVTRLTLRVQGVGRAM